MDLRDIIVWLGLIAIVVIVWDGLRRMKGKGAGATRRKTRESEPYIDPEEAAKKAQIARELPNGGARVREMTDSEKQEVQSRLNLRERVPMLMERVQVVSEPEPEDDAAEASDRNLQAELDFNSQPEPAIEENSAPQSPAAETDELSFSAVDDFQETEQEDAITVAETASSEMESAIEMEAEIDDETDFETAEDAYINAVSEAEPIERAPEPEPEVASDAAPLGPVEDLVVVHVMARRDEEFSGSSVLDLLLTAGLRHGPMDIFHYRNPRGVTEFSLANCVQPGTFDPDAMNQVNTPGVTLFMQLPNGADAMEAFEHMFEMARFLAQHLDGELLDEDHSSVTPQRVEYYREKIRSFERTRLIPS
ncbi:cell division protein ZipA [Reinekea blandensis]|uniref:Cell division protein ZipA n=1 Tax=Reinekea blandensis MED297 TaxID=314283 RepID=A4BHE4_9GAMM|nr:cell division protein ZipA [Reinekea blandensis]EAR08492.1 cell division protein ZipA [Reinekea sp. MED297] [Reinekea blandensis MED297]